MDDMNDNWALLHHLTSLPKKKIYIYLPYPPNIITSKILFRLIIDIYYITIT